MGARVIVLAGVFALAGLAVGWLAGWSRGYGEGARDERDRWSAWIVPRKSKDRP